MAIALLFFLNLFFAHELCRLDFLDSRYIKEFSRVEELRFEDWEVY